jgi:hypothetical protein
MKYRYQAFILSPLLVVGFGCEALQRKSDKQPAAETIEIRESQEVTAKIGDLPLLEIILTPSKLPITAAVGSMVLQIKNAPPLVRFECDLSGQPIDECVDGFILKTPSQVGEYQLKVFALMDSKIVAQGVSAVFKVDNPKTNVPGSDGNSETENPLALKLISVKQETKDLLIPNQPILLKQKLKTDFVFQIREPKSCLTELVVYCRFGSPSTNSPWTLCNTNQSMTLSPESQSLGRQSVEIEARCGDTIGPRLIVAMDAVSEDYEFLKLSYLKDQTNRFFLFPMRESDCALDDRRYECKTPGGSFSRCLQANILKDLKETVEVRLVCQDKIGPTMNVRPTN